MTDIPPSIDMKARRRALGVRIVFWTVAAFYAYGATVHVLNMLSLTGFDWFAAPLKWQVLDVVYLILDATVVIGLVRRMRVGVWAFFSAALSQIILYTVLRNWVLDVPDAFRPNTEQVAYLDTLVIFHILTCVAMSAAIYVARPRAGRA